MNRRRRLLLTALMAAAVLPRPARALAPFQARTIVIGGGFGGTACARTLKAAAPMTSVTLIEPREHFFTGPFTNAALAGVCSEGDIVRGPAALESRGIRWVRDRAVELDPVARKVRVGAGGWLQADAIVLSPGVSMRWDRIEGLDAAGSEAMPHAWLGDSQVSRLRARIQALRDGATLAISTPANPYRCPPGPYERASLLAWHLKRTGRGRCKILLLDAKDDFTKRALFQLGWDTLYPGMIEWVPRASGGEVVEVDAPRGVLRLQNGERVRAQLASVVPPQWSADIARQSDLTDESGWCPIRPETFESARHVGIHVIGDAAIAQPMPKSAFSANSQGKLVALRLAALYSGTAQPEPLLVNSCYSLLAPDYGISVGGLYGVVSGRLSTLNDGMSPLGAGREIRAREAAYAHQWYEQITRDSFG